ncbi:CATRA conflict system CASPASE/TPR repeat-associated protein [Paractinoplanes rishiriensis]|uniref:Uncharacterized protein n=1 Tax=Paractinoplanes rishiriensis TaxID=1050105 RepID=A0A919K4Y5_9ACTN|nr:CATRA conflict system CASPASE/TPR repeat-associated protein [Actinoplanes rishiriensis]GIE99644.1 hypothetical protein Ari01nite_71090 [Actinoplanes rishiriensis]
MPRSDRTRAVIQKPALLIHAFLDAKQATEIGSAAHACLTSLWASVSGLGLDEPVPGLPASLDDLNPATGAGLTVIAAARDPDPQAIRECLVYRHLDVVGVMVMLAPNDGRTGWPQQQDQWDNATSTVPLDAALGTAAVHLGLTAPTRRRFSRGGIDRAALAERIRPLLPAPRDGRWPACWSASDDLDITLWELPWRSAGPATKHRRLLAVAPNAREQTLDEWSWTTGDSPGLAPLTRYLLHTTKIRYEYGVITTDLPRLRRFADELSAGAEDLLRESEAFSDRGWLPRARRARVHPTDLRDAGRRVNAIATATDGFANSHNQLTTAVEAVRFARRNAAATVASFRSPPGGPLPADVNLADAVEMQASTEAATLAAVMRRAEEARRLADTAITDHVRDRQAELTVVQTSLLSGLIMALAAIQSLQIKVGLPGPLNWPLIALLASIAITVPLILPSWRLADLGRTSENRRLPTAALAFLSGSAGWFATSLVSVIVRDGAAAPMWWSVLAFAGSALTAIGVNVRALSPRRAGRRT